MRASQRSLITKALLLSYATIAWNGIAGTTALVVAFSAGSPATAGFALNALIDSSASVVLVWRFGRELRDPEAVDHLERRAQRFIVVAMFGVALWVAFGAVLALVEEAHAEESELAFLLAGVSLLVLPWLGWAKLEVAKALPSPALRGDGVLTLAAATLAGVTLAALFVNSALDWWWADPLAALVIAAALIAEATRITVRHQLG